MDPQRIAPGAAAVAWRLLGSALLCGLWLAGPSSEAGLVLPLGLAILGLVRWRVRLPAWTTLADQAACAAALLLWPPAAFAFALPVFDACLAARPLYALASLAALTALHAWSLPAGAALAFAALAGFSVHLWDAQLRAARVEADRDRRGRYELESLRSELVSANLRAARMAEQAERARIARDLHDNAGHEITAAGLALDASRGLRAEGDPLAEELFEEGRRRLAAGMEILRRTVRGISQGPAVGVQGLDEICGRFTACPVSLSVHGDSASIPVHAWGVLEPCLKEALANAARHGAEGGVDVSLDVGPHIVRLCVRNPARDPAPRGTPPRSTPPRSTPPRGEGMGLRSLAQRARAVGGSIAVDREDGFRLVCVLPLGRQS